MITDRDPGDEQPEEPRVAIANRRTAAARYTLERNVTAQSTPPDADRIRCFRHGGQPR